MPILEGVAQGLAAALVAGSGYLFYWLARTWTESKNSKSKVAWSVPVVAFVVGALLESAPHDVAAGVAESIDRVSYESFSAGFTFTAVAMWLGVGRARTTS